MNQHNLVKIQNMLDSDLDKASKLVYIASIMYPDASVTQLRKKTSMGHDTIRIRLSSLRRGGWL